MSPWVDRPTEVANLLNPAFAGALLRTSVEGYVAEAELGMPFEIAFLILPFCLHTGTITRLPTSVTATPLHTWLQREENRDVLVSFADRVISLIPFTREALLFASSRAVLEFDDAGRLLAGKSKWPKLTSYSNPYRNSGTEIKEAIRQAEFVGRWFALAGTTEFVFTILGVRP
jgi:hypothetical protein